MLTILLASCKRQIVELRRRTAPIRNPSRISNRYAKIEQEVERYGFLLVPFLILSDQSACFRAGHDVQSLSRFVNVQRTGLHSEHSFIPPPQLATTDWLASRAAEEVQEVDRLRNPTRALPCPPGIPHRLPPPRFRPRRARGLGAPEGGSRGHQFPLRRGPAAAHLAALAATQRTPSLLQLLDLLLPAMRGGRRHSARTPAGLGCCLWHLSHHHRPRQPGRVLGSPRLVSTTPHPSWRRRTDPRQSY